MESRFAVSFRIDAAGGYHLTTSGPLVFDSGEILFQFWRGTDLLAETFNGGETLDLHFDLAPGEYEIISYATAYPFASADGFQAGRAEFDFKLSATTAVPEPRSLVLLCCGIPALLMRCRRLPE
jgi:hypothetical protein